jgi:hypothetical protein
VPPELEEDELEPLLLEEEEPEPDDEPLLDDAPDPLLDDEDELWPPLELDEDELPEPLDDDEPPLDELEPDDAGALPLALTVSRSPDIEAVPVMGTVNVSSEATPRLTFPVMEMGFRPLVAAAVPLNDSTPPEHPEPPVAQSENELPDMATDPAIGAEAVSGEPGA